jgi:hypothetical protein
VTIASRPSCRNRTARLSELIWVGREGKYFCKWGWTGNSLICPSGKIDGHPGWVEPFAKPITVQKVMGIASLHPSNALYGKLFGGTKGRGKMAGSGAEMAAMLNTVRSITDWYVMKMPVEERKEFEETLKLGIVNMSHLVDDNWGTGKIDPQKYRDALSYELQRLLSLPRR